jgi:hypothetical protein
VPVTSRLAGKELGLVELKTFHPGRTLFALIGL